jgi:hypothetical protein
MSVSVKLDDLNIQHKILNSLLPYLETIQHADKLIECLTIYYALNNRLDSTIQNPALPDRFRFALPLVKTAINNANVKLNELNGRLTQANIPALQELTDKYGSINTELRQLKAASDIFLEERKKRLSENRESNARMREIPGGSRRRKRLKRSRRKTRR